VEAFHRTSGWRFRFSEATEFPIMAKRRGIPPIEINPEETALSEVADLVVRAPAGIALPALVEPC